MKKLLILASSLAVIPLVTSCTDYGVYGYGTTVGRPVVSNAGYYGGALAPLQVGFISTSIDRWAYDPFRRHYFDRSCGRYWDIRSRSYCTVVPRRHPVAVYPSGYRRGGHLACPSYLPRHTAVAHHRGFSHADRYDRFDRDRAGSHDRFSPVVHGSSRGSYPMRGGGSDRYRSDERDFGFRGSQDSDRLRRSVSPQPVRRSSGPSVVQRSSRLETISSEPQLIRGTPPGAMSRGSSSGRVSSPTVRSAPTRVVRSQPTIPSRSSGVSASSRSRATPTIRSTGNSSRASSGSSRSLSQARQRTR